MVCHKGQISFLIYMNDLVQVWSQCLPVSFADDTNLSAGGNDPFAISEMLSKELVELFLWLKVNKLSL